jgi:hypothetical protein
MKTHVHLHLHLRSSPHVRLQRHTRRPCTRHPCTRWGPRSVYTGRRGNAAPGARAGGPAPPRQGHVCGGGAAHSGLRAAGACRCGFVRALGCMGARWCGWVRVWVRGCVGVWCLGAWVYGCGPLRPACFGALAAGFVFVDCHCERMWACSEERDTPPWNRMLFGGVGGDGKTMLCGRGNCCRWRHVRPFNMHRSTPACVCTPLSTLTTLPSLVPVPALAHSSLQPLSTVKSAPQFSLGGGPPRSVAIAAATKATCGPGPVYGVVLPPSGPDMVGDLWCPCVLTHQALFQRTVSCPSCVLIRIISLSSEGHLPGRLMPCVALVVAWGHRVELSFMPCTVATPLHSLHTRAHARSSPSLFF